MHDARENMIPDPRLCEDPLTHGWHIEKKQLQDYERKREPHGLTLLVAIAAMVWMAVVTLWLFASAQVVPCEVQARVSAADPPPVAVIIDKTDFATAEQNRRLIEMALRDGGTALLPAGLVAVDRAIILPTGSTLAGVGAKTILRNTQTGAPFANNCTVQIHPQVYGDVGIGYADGFTRGKGSRITFADAAVANRYNVGGWMFTYKWNGYTTPTGAQTSVHRIEAKDGNTLTLNTDPKPEANAAVYTKAAVRVSGATEGSARLKVGAGSATPFTPGKLVYITAGPLHGNECCGELRRIMFAASDGLTLDRPLRSTYPYTLALAVLLTPIENVAIRDLTLQPFNDQSPPLYAKFAAGLSLVRVAAEGDIDFGQCFGLTVSDCTAGSIKLNGCRDALVSGGKYRQVYLEEMNSDCTFSNLLVSGSQTAGINAVAGSPSERITLRDCIVEQSKDMPIHLIGRECVVQNCTIRNSANPVPWVNAYFGGDGLRVNGLRSDVSIVFRSGRGLSLSRVMTPCYLGWRDPGDQPTGVTVACPAVDTGYLTPATLAQWTLAQPEVQ